MDIKASKRKPLKWNIKLWWSSNSSSENANSIVFDQVSYFKKAHNLCYVFKTNVDVKFYGGIWGNFSL